MTPRTAIVPLILLVLVSCGSSPKTHYFAIAAMPGTAREKGPIEYPVTVAAVRLQGRSYRLFYGLVDRKRDVRQADRVQVAPSALPDVKIIVPRRIGDARGFFSEVWNARAFATIGIDAGFVQDNHVRSPAKGTLRGLHYQIPPAAQGKLVRVTRGAIFDVAVDIRRGSPTFAHHAQVVLSGENWHQLWVPVGFAHGYCTLEDETEVQYKVTDYYSPPHERGIAWNDPQLLIAWPIAADRMVVSERDRQLPYVAHQPDLLEYGL